MTREVRHSSRVNTRLLDQGLAASSRAGDMFIRQGEAIADRVAAEGRGIENLGQAKMNFQTAYGAGLRIGLIVTGIGVAAMLVMFGASYVIDALRKPYSTTAFEALANENAALLERVKKLGVLVAERPAPVQPPPVDLPPEPPKDAVAASATEQSLVGIATAALALDPNSTNCPENGSYAFQCAGSHRYDDGRTYTGQWRNGLPEGEGKFILANGSILDATWKEGFPLAIKNQEPTKKVLKTVTIFSTIQDFDLPNRIQAVVVGHQFADGNSEDWLTAYCYAQVDARDSLSSQLDLSNFETRRGTISKAPYSDSLSDVISAANFKKAQDACPYQFSGFSD
jgi:hypothetical protein